jgi:hypothetical protein
MQRIGRRMTVESQNQRTYQRQYSSLIPLGGRGQCRKLTKYSACAPFPQVVTRVALVTNQEARNTGLLTSHLHIFFFKSSQISSLPASPDNNFTITSSPTIPELFPLQVVRLSIFAVINSSRAFSIGSHSLNVEHNEAQESAYEVPKWM